MPAIAGYTDIGQRALAYRYGAALAFTEMISAKGLVYGSEHTEALLAVTDSEPVKGVQLFGSEPEFMFKAARHEAIAKFDIVDVSRAARGDSEIRYRRRKLRLSRAKDSIERRRQRAA